MTDLVKGAAVRLRDGNPEPRVPCVILADNSGSMIGDKIHELNAGLKALRDELLKNEQAAHRVELALVTFGGKVEVVQEFVLAAEFKPPVLEAGGETPMGAAILRGLDLVEHRLVRYEASDLDSYGPWVFMGTDAEATDSTEEAAKRIRQAEGQEGRKQVAFFAVGVEGANMQRLAQISKRKPLKLRDYDFVKMFRWLAVSLTHVSMSQPGDRVPLPNPLVGNPLGWAVR